MQRREQKVAAMSAAESDEGKVECEDGGVKCSVTDESIGLVRPIRYAKSLLGD